MTAEAYPDSAQVQETDRTPAVGLPHLLVRGFVRLGPLPPILIALLIFFTFANSTFISSDNLLSVSEQGVFLLLVSLGQMMVLVSGGFDLSVGANVALTSIISSSVMATVYGGVSRFSTLSIIDGLLVALAVGLVVGLSNGIGVAFLGVNPFIVTLATSSVFAGVTLLVSGGEEVGGLPRAYVYDIGSGSFAGIPLLVLFTLPVVIALFVLLSLTRYGRQLYAIGGNPSSARVAGVRVRITLLVTYVICAVVTAYAGWLLTARVASGQPLLGGQFPLQSITAAVIGGASLRGGRGGVGGTLLGVVFIMVLTNGMNLMKLGSNQQSIAVGLALLFAVVADRLRDRARKRLIGTEAVS